MFPVHIHAMGVVAPCGCGRGALLEALNPDAPLPEPQALEMRGAGELLPEASRKALLCDVAPLERFFARRALRRMDRFSRLALLGACLCLEDAGLLAEKGKGAVQSREPGLGLVLATGYGAAATTFAFLDSCIDDGDALASPTHFSNSVHNAAAANVAIQLGVNGPTLTVSQFGLSFVSALATAISWLEEGRVRAVLIGGVDEACDVLAYCHARFAPGIGHPMSMPGEGAAFFLLRREAPAIGKGYGAVKDVRLLRGHAQENRGAAVSGAWGRGACRKDFRVDHARLWGNTPAAQALDLAAACLNHDKSATKMACSFEAEAGAARIELISGG